MEKKPTITETRERIMQAALNLFSENGFHATTTRLIAQFAGVNEVTLFRLFKTKLQLFSEILDHVKRMGFDSNRLDDLQMEPEDSIRFVIVSFLETLEEHPKEFKIMFHAILDEVEEYENKFIVGEQSRLMAFLEQAFKQCYKNAGLKVPRNLKLHAQMLISTLLGLASGRILTRTLPIKKYQRQEICNYVAELFLPVKS